MAWYKLVEYLYRFFFVVGIATSQTLPYLLSSLSRSLFIYIKNFYQERDFFFDVT